MAKEKVKSRHSADRTRNQHALREILETDNLANNIRYHLGMRKEPIKDDRGEVTGEKVVVTEDALLNQKGIESMVGFVRSIVDKNQTMSVYGDKEIRNIMVDLHETVARDLTYNWNEYGIKDKAAADKVVAIVTDNFYSALKRARKGVTLERTTDTTQTVTKSEVTESDDRGGGGFLSFG